MSTSATASSEAPKPSEAETSIPITSASSGYPTAIAAKDAQSKSVKKKPKKKKPSSAKSSAQMAANVSFQKLIRERELKKHDAAWLSTIPDPTLSQDQYAVQSPSFLENDVEIVKNALHKNGLPISGVTVEAFDCLLEEARKYAMELITDASDYAVHSHGTEAISPADLLLAKEMKDEERNAHGQYNLDALAAIAHETNQRPLPPIPSDCFNGVVLPPVEYTLLSRSFDVVLSKRNRSLSLDGKQKNQHDIIPSTESIVPSVASTAYGAKRGQKQVQIHLTGASRGE
jgi:histone H3/H4